jgi:hypothetical protein
MTKGMIAFKGEGQSDAIALNQIREQVAFFDKNKQTVV